MGPVSGVAAADTSGTIERKESMRTLCVQRAAWGAAWGAAWAIHSMEEQTKVMAEQTKVMAEQTKVMAEATKVMAGQTKVTG